MSEGIQNCCRICLDAESDHVPILGDLTISLQIKSCLGMTISANDSMPKNICTTCVSQLNDFYNFQLNARCSQDWLESSIEEQAKKTIENKLPVQPLPDSEYNSDSLLEFLNNTANIEEYLNNLGKEDIPSIVNMLDRNQENSVDGINKVVNSKTKVSPKKKDAVKMKSMKMQIDVLDSDIDIVKGIILKENEPRKANQSKEKNCFACKTKFDTLQKQSQHLSTCDLALRTCIHCNKLFDSKLKLQQHSLTHNSLLTCNCGKQFVTEDKLNQHLKTCQADHTSTMGYTYRCKQCKATFKERFQLYKHAKDHVLKAEERICDICGHTFIGYDALVKHKRYTHERPRNMVYRCKICQHKSADHKEIYLHVQKHCLPTKQEMDRHLCDTCGKCFTTKSTLLRHVLQHVSEHRCSICQKSFGDVKLRDQHVLQHVEVTICEKCGQNVDSFKLEAHLCV